eukprot:gene14226-19089_t
MEIVNQDIIQSGTVLQLTDTLYHKNIRVVIENPAYNYNNIILAPFDNPYLRFTVDEKQDSTIRPVVLKSCVKPNESCIFHLAYYDRANQLVQFVHGKLSSGSNFKSTTKNKGTHRPIIDDNRSFLLGINEIGGYYVTSADLAMSNVSTIFHMEILQNSSTTITSNKPKLIQLHKTKILKKSHFRRFVLEGYLHIPNVINKQSLDSCLSEFNRTLGIPNALVRGGVQSNFGKFPGHLSNNNVIRDLFKTNIENILDELFGENNYENSNISAQIAFRFPEITEDLTRNNLNDIAWHTDGLRQGKAHNFSLLVGVCLSDVEEVLSGNLLIWPSSHLLIH